jgi:type II secretory pathway pseudopilin PulG
MINQTKKAFSLIEVLLSATIIVILLYSLVAAGRSALTSSSNLHDKAQATLLAQQGIEIVRQIRDTNWIDTTSQDSQNWSNFVYTKSTDKWSSNITDPLQMNPASISAKPYRPYLTTFTSPSTGEVIPINKKNFTRKVKYTPLTPAEMPANAAIADGGDVQPTSNAVKVTVTVSWNAATAQSISISEVLTNWRPNY